MGERDDRTGRAPADETAFSNGVRLTGREWLVVGLFAVLLCAFAPSLWKRSEPIEFNHPRQVTQFAPRLPRYPLTREKLSERIGVVVEQHVPPGSWTTNLQQAYYDQKANPAWTVEHPYDNPLKPLRGGLPPAD